MDQSLLILAVVWAISTISVVTAYLFGGQFWYVEHRLDLKLRQFPGGVSGAYGEITLTTLLLVLIWATDLAAKDVSLAGMFENNPVFWLSAACGLGVMIIGRGLYTALTHRECVSHGVSNARLALCYTSYAPYSVINFLIGAVLLGLIVQQFSIDAETLKRLGDAALLPVKADAPLSEEAAIRAIDLAFTDIAILLNGAEDHLTPIFIVASGGLLLNFLILATPMRALFRDVAVMVTVGISVACAVLVSVGIYLVFSGSYTRLVTDAFSAFTDHRGLMATAHWEIAARYGDILQALEDRRRFIGFLSGITNEWGAVAALLGVLQWAASTIKSKDTAQEPAP